MPDQKQKQKVDNPQVGQSAQPQQVQNPVPNIPEPEKTLFSWNAPARPFKKREKEFWVKFIAIAGIFALILYIVEGAMPVILLIAIVFLFYILSSVEPETIQYSITNRGIKIADMTNNWELINRFWFSKRLDTELLVLETYSLSGRLELVINEKDKDNIRKAINKYVPEEEVSYSGLDNASEWISKRLS